MQSRKRDIFKTASAGILTSRPGIIAGTINALAMMKITMRDLPVVVSEAAAAGDLLQFMYRIIHI